MPEYTYTLLRDMRPVDALVAALTNVMGYWWFALLIGAFSFAIYRKQRNVVGAASFIFLAGSWAWATMPAEARDTAAFMTLFGFTAVLYTLMRGRQR